eukprot:2624235-Rhodomonas_salina.1
MGVCAAQAHGPLSCRGESLVLIHSILAAPSILCHTPVPQRPQLTLASARPDCDALRRQAQARRAQGPGTLRHHPESAPGDSRL